MLAVAPNHLKTFSPKFQGLDLVRLREEILSMARDYALKNGPGRMLSMEGTEVGSLHGFENRSAQATPGQSFDAITLLQFEPLL